MYTPSTHLSDVRFQRVFERALGAARDPSWSDEPARIRREAYSYHWAPRRSERCPLQSMRGNQRRHSTSPPAARRAIAGRVAALFDEHASMVLGLCRLLLRDHHEAEDAAQQTFVSAYRSLLRGNEPRDDASWLAAIARNECRARIRKRMRAPIALDGEIVAQLADPSDIVEIGRPQARARRDHRRARRPADPPARGDRAARLPRALLRRGRLDALRLRPRRRVAAVPRSSPASRHGAHRAALRGRCRPRSPSWRCVAFSRARCTSSTRLARSRA